MSNLMLGSSSYLLGTNDTADVLLNNISPMDANQPNGLADGIIQVQTALGPGTDLVGAHANLSERLAVQMPADGRLIPPGTIVMTGRSTAPTGWLICNGDAVDRTAYAALYSAIGEAFGPGNGTTTFNLPDMRSRVAAGVGTGTGGGASGIGAPTGGTALSAVALASWTGKETHVLTEAELPVIDMNAKLNDPGHDHVESAGGTGGIGMTNTVAIATGVYDNPSHVTVGNLTSTEATGITIDSFGSGTAHTIVQPLVGLNFIIRT
jgi:microcystin-dependent protein